MRIAVAGGRRVGVRQFASTGLAINGGFVGEAMRVAGPAAGPVVWVLEQPASMVATRRQIREMAGVRMWQTPSESTH
jgi:hypothetical protein